MQFESDVSLPPLTGSSLVVSCVSVGNVIIIIIIFQFHSDIITKQWSLVTKDKITCLVVVEAGLGHQHPDYQPRQLVLEQRPGSLVYTRGKPLQTSVHVKNN